MEHDPGVGGEKPVRPNAVALVQAAADEVGAVERNRVSIFSRLTGDLAKDQVLSLQRREDQCRSPFRLAEI